MRKLVALSGWYNVFLGAALLVPGIYTAIGIKVPHIFWGWLVAAFLWFTSAALILAARDLRRRASIVYWEAFLRFAAAGLMLTWGPEQFGCPAWFVGIVDFLWGCSYIFGLPKALNTSHAALFFDRVPAEE